MQPAGVARLFTDAPYLKPARGIRIAAPKLAAGSGVLAYTNDRAVVRLRARSLKD